MNLLHVGSRDHDDGDEHEPHKCTCLLCREGLRLMILHVFEAMPVWQGEWTISSLGNLSRFERPFYRSVLTELVATGELLLLKGDAKRVDRYLPPRYLFPRRYRWCKGGRG